MANHRVQAHFDRANWRLALLAPLWALQLLLAASLVGFFAWRLGDTVKLYVGSEADGDAPTMKLAWEAINIAMSLVVASCTLVEMCKFAAESLTPCAMLLTHVVKLACGAAILAFDLVVYVQRSEANYSLVGFGLDAALIVAAVALAIYAAVARHRLSTYDDYTYVRPVNVKGYGFRDGSLSHAGRPGSRSSLDKRSLTSSRLSLESADTAPVRLCTTEPTLPYLHKRDTQFDDYVARRGSRITSALRDVSPDSLTAPGMAVTVVKTRPRGSSYASDHVLDAVPEGEVEANGHGGAPDREALLGRGRSRSISGHGDAESLVGLPVLQEADVTESR